MSQQDFYSTNYNDHKTEGHVRLNVKRKLVEQSYCQYVKMSQDTFLNAGHTSISSFTINHLIQIDFIRNHQQEQLLWL